MSLPVVQIVTPARSSANNGNWRTAQRWSGFLRDEYAVILQAADTQVARQVGAPEPDVLIALHATRSHGAIRRWREVRGNKPVILILTGTDLYRDLPGNELARESLRMADRLVVLQPRALDVLPVDLRDKARVIYQSARLLPHGATSADRLNCVFVGHLREEKDPLTAIHAWRYLPRRLPITMTMVGGALDESLARGVRAAAGKDSRIRWIGAMSHDWTLRAIQRAHVLVNSSRMEGGAHVIAEAVRSASPVLASHMPGNLGMLGRSYPGYFEVGDARGLARLLSDCFQQRRVYNELLRQSLRIRGLFSPARERGAVRRLVAQVLRGHKMAAKEDL